MKLTHFCYRCWWPSWVWPASLEESQREAKCICALHCFHTKQEKFSQKCIVWICMLQAEIILSRERLFHVAYNLRLLFPKLHTKWLIIIHCLAAMFPSYWQVWWDEHCRLWNQAYQIKIQFANWEGNVQQFDEYME